MLKLWCACAGGGRRKEADRSGAVGGETGRDGERRVGRAGADEAVVEERGDDDVLHGGVRQRGGASHAGQHRPHPLRRQRDRGRSPPRRLPLYSLLPLLKAPFDLQLINLHLQIHSQWVLRVREGSPDGSELHRAWGSAIPICFPSTFGAGEPFFFFPPPSCMK